MAAWWAKELAHTYLLLAHVQREPVMAPFVPGRATANAARALSWIGVDMVQTEGDTMFLNQIQLQTKPKRLTRLSSLQDLQSYKSAKSPRAHVVAFLPSDTGCWPESSVEPPTTP